MAAATTAYNGIKKAVSVGREISAMTSAVSQWSKAVSDLDFLEEKAKNPPMYKMFSDTQSNALEIWSQKQKLKEMREELKSHISWTYGPSAWDEIVRIEAQSRQTGLSNSTQPTASSDKLHLLPMTTISIPDLLALLMFMICGSTKISQRLYKRRMTR